MKKLYYLMAISCMFLSLPLTSCDDDDDDEVIEEATGDTTGDTTSDETTTDETVVEEYFGEEFTGTLSVLVGGIEFGGDSQAIYVLENEDGTITLTINDFNFMDLDFGNIVVENCVVEETAFSGSATVDYKGALIDMDITGTYDGTNIQFSSAFSVGETEISFSFTTGDGTEEGETMPEFEIPENSIEYVGTLSGVYAMGGFLSFDFGPYEDTEVYFNGEVLAMEGFSVSGIELNDIYIYCKEGDFSDATAEAWMLGNFVTFEDVTGSVVVENDDITASVTLSLGDLGDVTVNFTTIATAPSIYDFAGETTEISGTLTTGEGTEGTAVTVTTGVNADGNAVYSISEFSVAGTYSSTTYSSVVIVVDGESVSAQVTTTNTLTGSTTYDATSATFTTTSNNDFTATVEYKALISTTILSLTFTEGTTGSGVTE